MNNLMIFEGNNVEVFDYEGNVLFNPKHVGECLDISDVNSSIRNFSEKQVIKLKNSNMHTTHFRKLHNTGEKFLTESGVYKLIFQSRKEDAEKFQDWVTDEVLPTIRKTGGFVVEDREEEFIHKYFPSFSDEVKRSMVLDLHNQNKKYKEEIRQLAPKAQYHDRVLNTNTLLTTTDIAKDLGMNAQKLNKLLYDNKVIYPKVIKVYDKDKEKWKNRTSHWLLYSNYEFLIKEGYADYHITSYNKEQGSGSRQTLKWTEKGRKWIIEFIEGCDAAC